MRIDGIMTCVGPLYQGYLLRSINTWADTLDSLTIATDKPMYLGIKRNIHVVITTAFTDNGAYLNKGKALNVAYEIASPRDWVLSIDADIVPPSDWRTVAEPQLRDDCIHGSHRYNDKGCMMDPVPLRPKGYFQMFRANLLDRVGVPPFEDHHPHAGRYDTAFYEKWPLEKRIDLGIHLTHLGDKSINWFGVGADPLLTKGVLATLEP